ncbi:prostate and testis expressed protein 1 [Pteropus medius]|uniref:prostate and testis expressed protein 1 n=1 Tax=Pteropus vampyrus TaxID=132908 RepID=UPI00196A8C81|nr:prostate and testis expressed protein 1 [Pteropus giganteus]
MNKSLLLGLLILLCCFKVLSGSFLNSEPTIETVQCRMCHMQFPREECSRGKGMCVATLEEACVTGRIFKSDGSPFLSFKGCLKKCANVNDVKWNNYSVNLRCCRGYNLCNENF